VTKEPSGPGTSRLKSAVKKPTAKKAVVKKKLTTASGPAKKKPVVKKPAPPAGKPPRKNLGRQSEATKILGKTNPGGRPTKFTDDAKSKILMALRAGNFIEVSAAFAGVSKETYYDWVGQGMAQESGPFREFSDSCAEAIAYAEVKSLQRIDKAGEKDWKAEAWRLERRFLNRWGRSEAKTVTVETGEGEKKTKVTISDLYKELQGEE